MRILKRATLILCLMPCWLLVALGQGSVNAANGTTTLFRTNATLWGGTAGAALSATGPWYYEVLTAPSTVTSVDPSLQQLLSAPWSDTGLMASNTGLPGRMNAGSGNVNFWPAGQTNSFIIVGWSASEGSSWSTVAARLQGAVFVGGGWSGGGFQPGFLGATTVGFRQAGGVTTAGTIPTALLFGAGADAQGQPITTPTDLWFIAPEPSSITLVGLGLAALTRFRRRR
jgi:hypothetical protein